MGQVLLSRLGVVYAQEAIISIFNKVSSPYHISQLTQEQGLDALKHRYDIEDWIKILFVRTQAYDSCLREFSLL